MTFQSAPAHANGRRARRLPWPLALLPLMAGAALAQSASTPPTAITVRDVALGQNQTAHIEAYGVRLMNIQVRSKTCAAHLPKRYVTVRGAVDLSSITLRQRGERGGSEQVLSAGFLFGSGAQAVPGRVEWTLRDCAFVRRVTYQDVNGVETAISTD